MVNGGCNVTAAPTGSVAAADIVLSAVNVTKRFPGVVANDAVTVDVRRGTVHCLLGENGAGKSTLAETFYGVHRPDEGVVEVRGVPQAMTSPRDAIALGIGMVHQHFELVAPMSAVDNVVLGIRGAARVGRADARKRLASLCESYGVELDLDAPVGSLPVGQQQWVEILKAIYVGAEILILDEPTAVLTPSGVESLFEALRRMTSEGLTVVMITHKLHEVMEIADDVTTLRKGRVVGTLSIEEACPAELTRMMVGRDVVLTIDVPDAPPGDCVVEVQNVSLESGSGRGSLFDVSLSVREREILGVAGVSGNGQDALFDLLVGLRQPDNGRVSLGGGDIAGLSAKQLIESGVASVPGDRISQGLMMDFQIRENLILGRHRSRRFRRRALLRRDSIDRFAKESVEGFDIAAPSPSHVTRVLSGGNLQKIVMARELGREPCFLVVHQPTRGLDIGASEYVRRRLIAERDRGTAILLISEDLDEILNLSTRICVIFDGRIAGQVDRESASVEQLGRWMGGLDMVSQPGAGL